MKYRTLLRSALVVGLCVLGGGVLRGEIIEQIIVKVNGEILTKTELENRQVAALRQMAKGWPRNARDAVDDGGYLRAG